MTFEAASNLTVGEFGVKLVQVGSVIAWLNSYRVIVLRYVSARRKENVIKTRHRWLNARALMQHSNSVSMQGEEAEAVTEEAIM